MIFLLFLLQNIDCGYSLELPRRANITKIVYPCIPQFCYIKVGFKGVYITRTCFHDDTVQLHLDTLVLCVIPAAFKNQSSICTSTISGKLVLNELPCEKTGLRGFRAGLAQTGLCSFRRWLDA